MVFVGPRFGEDLDPAQAEFVELRRKGVLVDANLANRLLGRNLSRAESINVDLASPGAGRGSGQRLQIGLQVFGIIGQSREIIAAQDRGGGIVGGLQANRRPGVLFDHDLLDGRGHHQPQIHDLQGAPQRDRLRLALHQLRRGGLKRVVARRNAREGIGAAPVSFCRSLEAPRSR